MRREDWNAALAIRNFWNDSTTESPPECPLFASIDHLLAGIVGLKIYPGNAISPCPLCGGEHRWVMLKQLLIFGFDLKPRGENRVLDAFYESLAEERELYGGEEGYRRMRKEADAFFAKNPSGDIYLL